MTRNRLIPGHAVVLGWKRSENMASPMHFPTLQGNGERKLS